MNKRMFGSIVISMFFLSMLIVATPAFACTDENDCGGKKVSDFVNIGNKANEQGHNLQGWGPAISVFGTDFRSTYSPITGDKGKSASLDSSVPSSTCVEAIPVESKLKIFTVNVDDTNTKDPFVMGIGVVNGQFVPPDQYRDGLGRTVTFTEKTITIHGLKLVEHTVLATPAELQIRLIMVPFKVYVNGVLVITNTETDIGFSTFSVVLPASLNGQTNLTVTVEATGNKIISMLTFVDWVNVDYCEGCTVQTGSG